MKKLYTVLMIVMPIFVGSGGVIELIMYLSHNGTAMNPVICAVLAVVGMLTGIANILKLIDKN